MSQPMKRYWVYHLNILDDKPSNEPCIKHEVFKAVYLAADVEAVLADNAELLKKACECDPMYGFTCHVHNANYHPGQALLDALAAKEARIGELERFKQYVHRCVEEHGSYKP